MGVYANSRTSESVTAGQELQAFREETFPVGNFERRTWSWHPNEDGRKWTHAPPRHHHDTRVQVLAAVTSSGDTLMSPLDVTRAVTVRQAIHGANELAT